MLRSGSFAPGRSSFFSPYCAIPGTPDAGSAGVADSAS
ncbi:hypothetical protein APY03_6040 [Variovorax sp. WDL1]|nr:hypothetical protein APY03_6040 [Variovorax sp. WDL1]